MNMIIWFFLLFALLAISGCASSPLKERVGIKESGSEYLPAAATVAAFDPSANGFSVKIPSKLNRDMACKEFVDLDGNPVEACRLTFRALVFDENGSKRFLSVYLLQGTGYFFLNDATVPNIAILASDGTEVSVPAPFITTLPEKEARRVRANIAFDMPNHSTPIKGTDGIRVFTGEGAQKLVGVPSLVTQAEKNRRCGLYSGSLGEIAALATANPVALASTGLWRITQISCATHAETQYLRENSSPEIKDPHSTSIGNFVPEGENQ